MIGSPQDEAVFRSYVEHKTWSPHLIRFLDDFVRVVGGKASFLDIGAQIGTFSVALANNNPDLIVHAFEPEPGNFRHLCLNTALHPQVHCHGVALAGQAGMFDFEISQDNLGDHRLRTQLAGGDQYEESLRRVIQVRAVALDALNLELPKPLIVKIDTQGAEALVIEGGLATLADASLIVMEFWPYGLRRIGGDVSAIYSLISQFQTGAVLQVDASIEQDKFEPVAKVLDKLKAMEAKTSGEEYVDVLLRKGLQ